MIRNMVFSVAMAAAAVASAAHAQMPGPGREALPAPAQPGAIALPANEPDREVWHLDSGQMAVRNVTRPTLTPVLPVGGGTGTAVIVAPGGGFLGLAIEKEGWDVARWLANHGIAAFVLKYRVLPTPASQPEFADKLVRLIHGEKVGFGLPDDTPPEALADGLAALRYVHDHSRSFGIDPARIGFMGFSAGGFIARSIVEHAGADDMPAFVVPVYPNMRAMTVPANAPPMFVAVAADDFLLKAAGEPALVTSYRQAGKSIEFHLFSTGGHGFGLGQRDTANALWPELMLAWLGDRGLLQGKK